MKYFFIYFFVAFIIIFTLASLKLENNRLKERVDLLEEILLKVEDNKFIHETPLEITDVQIIK